MSRVPQEAFLSTECVFRTVEGPLRYRMPQTAERRRALPAANATTARKEEPSAKSAARGAAASKKITAKKFAIPPQICSTPPGRVDVAKIHSMPPQSCPMPPKIHIACPDSTFYGIRRHTFWALILPIGDAHCTLSQLVTGYPYTRKVPYKAVKCHLGAENGARTRDLNLLARPPQTAFISVDDGSYATDPREKEANEFA